MVSEPTTEGPPPAAVVDGPPVADFWAEFERRRRADRQLRRQQKKVSEVQLILEEVRNERTVSSKGTPDLKACPSPARAACGANGRGSGGVGLGSASASQSRLASPSPKKALSFSPSPRRPSEVQKILAEVQQERLAAAEASPGPKPTAKPKDPKATQAPIRPSTSSLRTASPSRPSTSSSARPTSATQNRHSTSSWRASSPKRPDSSSPKRRHQLNNVATSEAAQWAAGLRREKSRSAIGEIPLGDRYASGGSGQPVAYPAGGWDDRTACPKIFDKFAGGVIKRQAGSGLEAWLNTQPRDAQGAQGANSQPWDWTTSFPKGFGKVAEPLPRRAGSRSRSQDNSRGAGCQPRQPQPQPQPTEQQPPQKQQPQQQQQQQEQQQQQQETQQQQQQQQQTPQKQQQSSATRVQQQEGEQPQKQDEQEQQLQQQVQQIQHAAESAFPIAHSEQPEGTGRLVASADSGPVSSCSVADDKVAPLEQMTSLIVNGPAEQGAAESFKPLDLLVDDC
ncbi:unnamed protein product [Polarella glacialis]|uniref:Uncharacterized protein n=1 Tax=Polarella glacialis TaxID=89957 RepID=A0A813FMD8_POLGL|nr:unnamed protein product [Polarella glacialis]